MSVAVAELEHLSSEPRRTLESQVLTRSELRLLPAPEYLIDGTLLHNGVTVLAGWTGTGKSFIALDWACCIATGKPWQQRTARQGPVLYVVAEGVAGVHQRIAAWEHAWQRDVEMDVLPIPVNLLRPVAVLELERLIRERQYALVVLDTLARCLVSGDENSAKDMGVAVDAADRLRRAASSGVLLVHHTGKDRDTVRGSSALESGVDTVYRTKADGGTISLSRTKAKDAALHDELELSLLPVLSSAVVQVSHRAVGLSFETIESQRRLLAVARDLCGTTGLPGGELKAAADLPRTTYYRALEALLSQGVLLNIGTQKRPHIVLPAQSSQSEVP